MAIFTQLLEIKLRPIWAAEGPEPALFGPLAIPVVVAGEIDVLPNRHGYPARQTKVCA